MINKVIKTDNRVLGMLLFSPLLLLLIFGGEVLRYGLLVLSSICIYEFYHAFTNRDIHANLYLGILFNVIFYVFLLGNEIDENHLLMIFVLFLLVCLGYTLFSKKNNIIDAFVTFIPSMYISIPWSLLLLIDAMPKGNLLIWIPLITTWCCDILAYYIGKNFGRIKLSESISPKKTVEGSIGGIIGSVGVSMLVGVVFGKTLNISLIHFLFMGIIAGIVGQMGDLVASSIKRYNGIKDFSHIIPAHGGMLDRFDSVLFNNMAIFLYLSIILKL
ncbi:MAG: phosphatidate cytidylyltransferase [Oscillospiraceae bacterium]|nr:phosphatidate cytidylyltransferase [Oscillospiraceae bacterium]